MRYGKNAASLALAILLGASLLAFASTQGEKHEVFGSWVLMDLENAGMHIYTTFTIHSNRIDISSRCSYGDKQVEANATAVAEITEDEILVTEGSSVEKEYSPGFLKCRASIKPMRVNYRLNDGKLILTAPGQDQSHELRRPSSD